MVDRFWRGHAVALLVGLALATLTFAVWRATLSREKAQLQVLIGGHALALQTELETELRERIVALQRMADRSAIRGGTPLRDWEAESRAYMADQAGFRSVEWIDGELRRRWILTRERLDPGPESDFVEGWEEALRASRARGVPEVSRVAELEDGEMVVLLAYPILGVGTSQFGGFMSGTFHIGELLQATIPSALRSLVAVEVRSGETTIYSSPDFSAGGGGIEARMAVRFVAEQWTFRVRPTPTLLAAQGTILPLVLLMGGGLTTLLAMLLAEYAARAGRSATELGRHQATLEHEVRQRTVELNEKAATLDVALEAAGAGVWSWELEAETVVWDERAEALFGLEPGSFDGSYASWASLVLPEDLPAAEAEISAALEKKGPFRVDYRVDVAGDLRHFVASGVTLLDDDGAPRRMVGVVIDVTRERRAREALVESEERFRATFEQAAVGIAHVSPDGTFLRVNQKVCGIVGYRPEELMRMRFQDITHPDDLNGDLDGVDAILGGERASYEMEKRYVTREGKAVWVYLTVSLMHEADGTPKYFIAVIQDIQARKRLQAQVQEANRVLEARVAERTAELARSNEELEQFAYVASHDLQEPLRMVTSYLQLLEERYGHQLDGDALDFMGFAVDGATRMKVLIEDLLEFSRLGTRKEERGAVDLNDVFEEVCSTLAVSAQDAQAVIESSDLPTVVGDRSRMVQLFQNLIGNAIKYRSDDPPRISVSGERFNGEWRMAVRDNGIGIAERHAGRIFEIFQRLHSDRTVPGTGIGLASCKKIVEGHGGRIWVDSTVGEGSTFRFTLPHATMNGEET